MTKNIQSPEFENKHAQTIITILEELKRDGAILFLVARSPNDPSRLVFNAIPLAKDEDILSVLDELATDIIKLKRGPNTKIKRIVEIIK